MIYEKMIKEGKKTTENHEDDENSRRYGGKPTANGVLLNHLS